MHIASQSPQELVVLDSSRWISGLCAGAGALVIILAAQKHEPKGFLGAAFFLLFAVLADRRTLFTFDALQRVVRWTGHRFLKAESGAIPFAHITGIAVEAMSAGDGGTTYRLALLTAEGSTPMAYAYSGIGNLRSIRETILSFMQPDASLRPTPESSAALADDASLRSLLRQGRKIDAVSLLRSSESLSLTQAMQRVEAVDAEIKAGQ
ncbi:MAG: hypothetical protein WCC26_08725 [Terracidiphilus sp.]